MRFGIIKERKNPPDRRVVFSPLKLKELKEKFSEAIIKVEPSAIRIFSDDAYQKNGIEVLGMLGLFNYGFQLAIDNFKAAEVQLHTLSDYDHLILEAEKSEYVEPEEISVLQSWRVSPSEWKPS